MSAVFADSFYFIGLLNPDDRVHGRCVRFSNLQRPTILTTAWVLVELADALAAPPNRSRAGEFIQRLKTNPRTRIIEPSQSLFDRGLNLYNERADKSWSLTDCISFVVMREEQLVDALTGDRHFEQAGFNALLK